MKINKYKLFAVTLLAAVSVEIIGPAFAAKNNYAYNLFSKEIIVKADEVLDNDGPVSEEKLNEFLQNPEDVPNVQEMSASEFEEFKNIVFEEARKVGLPSEADVEDYAQGIIDLYNPTSSVYADLEAATEQISDAIDENHENLFDKITGEKVLAAAHGAISNSVLASAINVGISLAVGGAVGAGIKAIVMRHGAQYATNLLARKVTSTLITFGIRQVTGINSIISHVVRNILDPGSTVARWMDSRDKIRNNGWVEWW